MLSPPNHRLLSKIDPVGGNIKRPVCGLIEATGSVRHHEIIFRVGVPRPKRITAFDQIVDHKRPVWREDIAAVTAEPLWITALQINCQIDRPFCGVVDADLDLLSFERSGQERIDAWIANIGIWNWAGSKSRSEGWQWWNSRSERWRTCSGYSWRVRDSWNGGLSLCYDCVSRRDYRALQVKRIERGRSLRFITRATGATDQRNHEREGKDWKAIHVGLNYTGRF